MSCLLWASSWREHWYSSISIIWVTQRLKKNLKVRHAKESVTPEWTLYRMPQIPFQIPRTPSYCVLSRKRPDENCRRSNICFWKPAFRRQLIEFRGHLSFEVPRRYLRTALNVISPFFQHRFYLLPPFCRSWPREHYLANSIKGSTC